MNAQLLERAVALAAVALVATLTVLAFGGGDEEQPAPASQPVPPAQPDWRQATVGTYGPGFFGRTTPCDVLLTRRTRGIAHPVLPCGARIVVGFGEKEVDTRVVDRGPYGTGQDFALTEALAEDLGVKGVQAVRWRFSSGGRR